MFKKAEKSPGPLGKVVKGKGNKSKASNSETAILRVELTTGQING